jgi:hypothetical protein
MLRTLPARIPSPPPIERKPVVSFFLPCFIYAGEAPHQYPMHLAKLVNALCVWPLMHPSLQ